MTAQEFEIIQPPKFNKRDFIKFGQNFGAFVRYNEGFAVITDRKTLQTDSGKWYYAYSAFCFHGRDIGQLAHYLFERDIEQAEISLPDYKNEQSVYFDE